MELNEFPQDALKENQDEREIEPLLSGQISGNQDTDQESHEEEVKDDNLTSTTKLRIWNFVWKFVLPILYILFIGLFPLTYHEYMSLDPAPHPEGLESTIFFCTILHYDSIFSSRNLGLQHT